MSLISWYTIDGGMDPSGILHNAKNGCTQRLWRPGEEMPGVISCVPVFWSWLGVVTRSKSALDPRIVFAFSFCGSKLFFGLGGSSSLRHGEATAVLPSSRRLCLAYVCSHQGIA